MPRYAATVEFDVPPEASREEISAYIADAVASYCGALRPPGGYGDDDEGDPMWGLDRDTVAVTDLTRRNKRRTV